MRKATLRVCASCEWIFVYNPSCPKCGFGHYSARYVYGNACYRLRMTQEPWMRNKQATYTGTLLEEIRNTNQFKAP